MTEADVRTIVLASGIDLDAFRAACRRLVGARVTPDQVVWQTADAAAGELFSDPVDEAAVALPVEVPATPSEGGTLACRPPSCPCARA